MKALIVGAGGQLGRALQATAPASAKVVALDRCSLDVTDVRAVGRAVETHAPDVLLNAAAYTAVDKAESDVEAAFRLNRDAPAHLAQAARDLNAQFVHVSTDFVFDGLASSPYAPDHAVSPLSVYGASKAAGENEVRSVLPQALIVRTAWVYAATGRNFVRTMLRLMHEQSQLRVVADQIGTPTHAASLARAVWGLVTVGSQGIRHFTDAGAASWYDFAVAIKEEALALGLVKSAISILPIRTEDYPTPARRPSYSMLDNTGTYSELGGPAAHWRDELRVALKRMKETENG